MTGDDSPAAEDPVPERPGTTDPRQHASADVAPELFAAEDA